METVLIGIFFILHGLVHLLYAGQSGRFFELRPGMVWPDGSWLFAKLLGEVMTRNLASILLSVAALGFMAGGIGLFIQQAWWRPTVVGATVLSVAIFLSFWDDKLQAIPEKGGIGILISLVILVVVLVFKWPV